MLCLEYKGDMGNKAILNFTPAEEQEALDLISQQMEEIFAAPLDIDAVQKSVLSLLAALPEETALQMEFSCTEQEAELTLLYPAPMLNPLENLAEPLPIDQVTYEWTHENRLTLCKTLM